MSLSLKTERTAKMQGRSRSKPDLYNNAHGIDMSRDETSRADANREYSCGSLCASKVPLALSTTTIFVKEEMSLGEHEAHKMILVNGAQIFGEVGAFIGILDCE